MRMHARQVQLRGGGRDRSITTDGGENEFLWGDRVRPADPHAIFAALRLPVRQFRSH